MAGQLQIDSMVQDCFNSIADAHELLQSCPKPSISVFITDVLIDIYLAPRAGLVLSL